MSLRYSSAPCPHIGILLHTTDMRTVKCHTTRLIWNGKTLVVNEIFLQISKFHLEKTGSSLKFLFRTIADSKKYPFTSGELLVKDKYMPRYFSTSMPPISKRSDVIWLFPFSSPAVYATPAILKEPIPGACQQIVLPLSHIHLPQSSQKSFNFLIYLTVGQHLHHIISCLHIQKHLLTQVLTSAVECTYSHAISGSDPFFL